MKRLIIILFAAFLTAGVFAQTPQKMSYQAVVRDNTGQLIISTTVGMQVSILKGSLPEHWFTVKYSPRQRTSMVC